MTTPLDDADNANSDSAQRPTNVRLLVVMIAAAMSVLLYLDRFCVSFAADFIKEDLDLSHAEVGYFLSAFFFSYALAQVPAGWLSDRFGARIMLAIYIVVWSLFTAMIGAVYSLSLLLLTRLACGLGQAGAYPTSASVLSKWVPFGKRGAASAWVSLGGRCGGAIAPLLTAFLIVQFVPIGTPVELKPDDLIDGPHLCAQLCPQLNVESVATEDTAEPTVTRPGPAGMHVWSLMHQKEQEAVCRGAQQYRLREENRQTLTASAAGKLETADDLQLDEQDRDVVLSALNRLLDDDELYDEQSFKEAKLQREAIVTLKQLRDGEPLADAERRRFYRLLLEGAFPDDIVKLYVLGWRPVMFVYGFAGLFVAALVAVVYRNRPEDHRWCNRAECELIASGRPPGAPSPHGKPGMVPIGRLIKSGSMWLDCIAQVGTNIGWIFLVTWLPRYLISQHNVPVLERGVMAMTPLLAGIVGMYAGGWLTDSLARRIGVRWGRRLPLSITRFSAAAGYGLCLWLSTLGPNSPLNSPWYYVAAFSLVAFSTDLGVPAAWAFKQDVGGRYVGSILGWGNMWGNLGASVSPFIYNHFLGENPGPQQWNAMFGVCIAAFIVSGLCGLGIDAATPIAPPDDDGSDE